VCLRFFKPESAFYYLTRELTGRIYYDVGGFYEGYFEGKSWMNNARYINEESGA
jgi:hypothetical protein